LSQKNRFSIKLIVTGDAAVGKTSLIKRFTAGEFLTDYMATIGTEIIKKTYKFKSDIIDLNIWDLSGQPIFRNVAKRFIDGADLVIFMFDVSRRETFDNIKEWYGLVTKNLGKDRFPRKIPSIIIGNKIDLVDKRVISLEEGGKLAQSLNTLYMETSAKENKNVNEVFVELILKYIKMQSQRIDYDFDVKFL